MYICVYIYIYIYIKLYIYTHTYLFTPFKFQKAGGPFGNDNSDCSYRKDHRTPQNHMTTDPNKLWKRAEVAVKFDSHLGELTASSRYTLLMIDIECFYVHLSCHLFIFVTFCLSFSMSLDC